MQVAVAVLVMAVVAVLVAVEVVVLVLPPILRVVDHLIQVAVVGLVGVMVLEIMVELEDRALLLFLMLAHYKKEPVELLHHIAVVELLIGCIHILHQVHSITRHKPKTINTV
jgi:hypothetical protein